MSASAAVYTEIAYDVEDSVLTIVLDRPAQLNAFTQRMLEELLDALTRAAGDDAVRCIVVTGRGRAFCAGADLSAGAGTFDASREGAVVGERDGGGILALALLDSPKPLIAAINGHAVGIGASMTLAMDIRFAADSARLGFPFTRRGIAPDACSSYLLPRMVGMQRAQEWMLTGRLFSAAEALQAGMLRSVHPAESVLDEARALALEIATGTSAVSVALTRQILWRGLSSRDAYEAHLRESRALRAMGASADAAEGVSAFLEKRDAHFPMRVSTGMPDVLDAPDP
jgi:enoyl-CoA hydratase/carnithine racemase